MNSPIENSLIRLLWIIAAGMFGLLLLLILCTPIETHRRSWDGLKQSMREIIEPHALFFKWNIGIAVGLYLLGRICPALGEWFDWPDLTAFGNGCKFFAWLSCLGFLRIIGFKAEAQQNQKVAQALFGPRTVMSNTFNSYGDNFGNQAAGHGAHPQARIDSNTIHQQINSLADKVAIEPHWIPGASVRR